MYLANRIALTVAIVLILDGNTECAAHVLRKKGL